MEPIRDQAEAEETTAAADNEGGGDEEEEEEDDDLVWNVRKNIQEEGEEGRGGGSGRGSKGGSAKDDSYVSVAPESTPATGSTDVESYALVIEA